MTLSHHTSASGQPLASWPVSLVSLYLEAQVKEGDPYIASKTYPPMRADDPKIGETVKTWETYGNEQIAARKIFGWRICQRADELVHSFGFARTNPPKQPTT